MQLGWDVILAAVVEVEFVVIAKDVSVSFAPAAAKFLWSVAGAAEHTAKNTVRIRADIFILVDATKQKLGVGDRRLECFLKFCGGDSMTHAALGRNNPPDSSWEPHELRGASGRPITLSLILNHPRLNTQKTPLIIGRGGRLNQKHSLDSKTLKSLEFKHCVLYVFIDRGW